MSVKDRGLKKWQPAFIMPELGNLLSSAEKEYYAEKKPEIDEQQYELIEQIVCESMEYQMGVAISYYQEQRTSLIIGHIHYFDEINRHLKVIDRFGNVEKIMVGSILDIRFHDE